MTLSSEPVSTRVFSIPLASIRTAVKTNATSEMPPRVSRKVPGRLRRLLRMYSRGLRARAAATAVTDTNTTRMTAWVMPMVLSSHLPEAVHDFHAQRAHDRDQGGHKAGGDRRTDGQGECQRFGVEEREPAGRTPLHDDVARRKGEPPARGRPEAGNQQGFAADQARQIP